MQKSRRTISQAFAPLLAILILTSASVHAAEVSKSTAKILTKLGLEQSVLTGLESELAVPAEVLAGARKEAAVTILGSWTPKDFRELSAPFIERYPFIKIKYNYGRAYNARAIKPLVSFKEGRYITDVITGFGGSRRLYKEANAFEDLRMLPGFKNALGGNDEGGGWMAIRNRYWCIAYNTNLIKKDDLPKTWDELITKKALHDGQLGIASRPQLWLLMLWKSNGQAWVEDHIEKFFKIVKPQIRKEGLSAMISLVTAGEVPAALPAAPGRVQNYAEKGAPISWHCPVPIPRAVSRTAILRGAPNVNAAKIWANWLVSKEGQISQFAAEGTSPSHKDLQVPKLLNFSEQIVGRKHADEDEANLEALNNAWKKYNQTVSE